MAHTDPTFQRNHGLYQAGGAMLEWEQRLQLDLLALHAAKQSSQDLALAAESIPSHRSTGEAALQLHLGCLETLLAAVATPSAARPAFLPQAMQLFKQVLGALSRSLYALLHILFALPIQSLALQICIKSSGSHLCIKA